MHKFNIDILHYRPTRSDKALKAYFTLVNHDHGGEKILDCRHFQKDGREWFSYPQKEVASKEDPEKKDFIPYISYTNKDYANELQRSVIAQLHKVQGNKQKDSATQAKPSDGETPPDWF